MTDFLVAAASPRVNTEDRSLVTRAMDAWIVCVADGAGGMSGGARAAEMVIRRVEEVASEGSFHAAASAWATFLESLDAAIERDLTAGETTAIVLAVTADGIVGASSGDSRAYLLSPAGFVELTAGQRRRPLLGSGRAIACSFRAATVGTLVVATDGLFDYAPLDDIRQVLAAPSEDPAEALVRLIRTRHRELPDDVAVVLGRLG
jgi:PPM family protein phosphatase